MKPTSRTLIFTFTAILAVSLQSHEAHAGGGWFKKATGITTPKVIRDIAPNGISWTPSEGVLSYQPTVEASNELMIDANGAIHYRKPGMKSWRHSSTNGQASRQLIGGHWYWVYKSYKR